MNILSVIIPFRASSTRTYIQERVLNIANKLLPNGVHFIFVDSGSDKELSLELQDYIVSKNHTYLYHESRGETFAIGNVRDFGVQHATSPVVTFYDVDYISSEAFFEKLLILIEVKNVANNPNVFFTVPVLFLTELGTKEIINKPPQYVDFTLMQDLLHGCENYVQTIAFGSSIMVCNRHKYLSMGGHRPEYKGHGYEDFELMHRIITQTGMFEKRASNYYHDSRTWFNTTYSGFRATFALLGRDALMHGVFAAHLFHKRTNELGYKKVNRKNRRKSLYYFKKYDNDHINLPTLSDLSQAEETLLFLGKPNTPSSECLRTIFPLFKKVVFCSERTFTTKNNTFDEDAFRLFLSQNNIQRLLFTNPYGNECRIKIYEWALHNKFSFYAFDRGPLPDSWFFDEKGFNADSETYSKKNWDTTLTEKEKLYTQEYIHTTVSSDKFLEKQGPMLTANGLRKKLKLHEKRILFVPLQRPNDTVIKYFSGTIGSSDNFLVQIDKLAGIIKQYGWEVLCKKHPLETSTKQYPNITYCDNDANIIDLISMCDAVALINSGVGIYAAMLEKPCYIFGEAFYAHEGINKKVDSIDELIFEIKTGLHTINKTEMYKFIHYLVSKVYSFGKSYTRTRVNPDNSLATVTYFIDFYSIKLLGKEVVKFDTVEIRKIKTTDFIFEPYFASLTNKTMTQIKAMQAKLHKGLQKIKITTLFRFLYAYFPQKK